MRCAPGSSEIQTTKEVRQLDAPEQRSEAEGDVLENVPEEERNIESFGKWHVPDFSPSFFGINVVSSVTESGGLSRACSPHRYPDNAESSAGNYPDYPEEVALYPSSVSDAPSVTGLYNPGTTRVFDIFQDDRIEQSDRRCDRRSRKQSLEDTYISSLKRRRN